MLASLAVLGILAGGILPEEMARILAERHRVLDKLIVDMSATQYYVPAGGNPLDRRDWQPVHPFSFEHRLTIVRPNVLDEELTNIDTEFGQYRPSRTSVFNGSLRQEAFVSVPSGRAVWRTADRWINVERYASCPLLYAVDIHPPHSPIAQLNTARLFAEYPVTWVRSVGDVHTYTVTIDSPVFPHQYFLDLDGQGLPLRISQNGRMPDKTRTGEHHLYTLATVEVNGALMPSELIFVTANFLSGESAFGVDHFEIHDVTFDPTLTAEDVRLEPPDRNVIIQDFTKHTYREFDEEGNLVREYGPPDRKSAPKQDGPDVESEGSAINPWRTPLGIAAGVAALFTGSSPNSGA